MKFNITFTAVQPAANGQPEKRVLFNMPYSGDNSIPAFFDYIESARKLMIPAEAYLIFEHAEEVVPDVSSDMSGFDVRILRDRLALSAEEMAAKLNCSISLYRKLESGHAPISNRIRKRIISLM